MGKITEIPQDLIAITTKFDKYDTNGDLEVTRAEYATAVGEAKAATVFETIDDNRDGRINLVELVSHTKGLHRFADSAAKVIASASDRSEINDGQYMDRGSRIAAMISAQYDSSQAPGSDNTTSESREENGANPEQRAALTKVINKFVTADANVDLKVSHEELKAMYGGNAAASSKASEQIARYDTDSDNQISLAEYLQGNDQDQFVQAARTVMSMDDPEGKINSSDEGIEHLVDLLMRSGSK